MTTILIILGILCLGYYFFLRSLSMDFAVIWFLAGVFFLGLGSWLFYLYSHEKVMPALIKWLLTGLIIGGLTVFLILEGLIISKMKSQGLENLDYVIVLGAQVKGDRPSRALRRRIETAAEYLKKNPHTMAILSGGQGPGENKTEAKCMQEELVNLGIDDDRLIMEEKSVSTRENLIFSGVLAPVKKSNTGLISQNFHIYRSLQLARHQGYENICGIAAPSEWMYQPHFMVREAFALAKEKLAGNI